MKIAPLLCLALAAWLASPLIADDKPKRGKSEKPKAADKEASPEAPVKDEEEDEGPSQAELDERFEKLLSGATLAGQYTVSGAEGTSVPKEEKYTIAKVSKIAGSLWLFQVRIQYGGHDKTVPLPLPVKWTAETPMIVLDKVTVPGFGTFSARVVFHEGKYAGTWSGGDHGGHLFGRIVPAEEEKSEKEAKE
jgi:hypothetical protein